MLLDEERGERRTGRVRCGKVEPVEVVVRRLDLPSVDDAVAEAEEHVLDLPPDLRDEVQAAPGMTTDRERDVDALGGETRVELRTGELVSPARDRGLDPLARRVQPTAGLRVAHLAQREREGALATQILEPDRLDLVRRRRGGDRREGSPLERLDIHGRIEASK